MTSQRLFPLAQDGDYRTDTPLVSSVAPRSSVKHRGTPRAGKTGIVLVLLGF